MKSPDILAVLAKAVPLPGQAETGEFVYMPAGTNVLTPSVNGKAEEVTVIVDASAAEVLQADLAARLSTGIKPALDYDHSGGRASGWPQSFYWKEGVGVICRVEWTASAKKAIHEGEYRYFSPEFRWNRESKKVAGLRATGPIGGLVNDPAFRAIPAIAARNNNLPDDNPESPQTTHKNNMNDKIVAALDAVKILSTTEAAGDNAGALVIARITELQQKADVSVKAAQASESDKRTIEELQAKLKAKDEKEADSLITAAIAAGQIKPQDKDSIGFWKSSLIANSEIAVKALNALPVSSVLKATAATGGEKEVDNTDELQKREALDSKISAKTQELIRASNNTRSYKECWNEAEALLTAEAAQ